MKYPVAGFGVTETEVTAQSAVVNWRFRMKV
jgi:hypothetical protein